jgi:mono/diheme cytochrome c family protein
MQRGPAIAALAASAMIVVLFGGASATGQTEAPPSQPAQNEASIDVNQLFATTCGWCHSDGGRSPGKGPQLMDTKRSDDFIRNRIKVGKEGAMPAFGGLFDDAQIDAIIKYIRTLKPE